MRVPVRLGGDSSRIKQNVGAALGKDFAPTFKNSEDSKMATVAPSVNSEISRADFVNQFLDERIDQFTNGLEAADAIVREAETTHGKLALGECVNLQVTTCAAFNTRRWPRHVQ